MVQGDEAPAPGPTLLGESYDSQLMRRPALPDHQETHSAYAGPRHSDHFCVDRETAAECRLSSVCLSKPERSLSKWRAF